MLRRNLEDSEVFLFLSDADIDAFLAPMAFLPAHSPMLTRGTPYTYKFSRDVIFVDYQNVGFARFYFWESFVFKKLLRTWFSKMTSYPQNSKNYVPRKFALFILLIQFYTSQYQVWIQHSPNWIYLMMTGSMPSSITMKLDAWCGLYKCYILIVNWLFSYYMLQVICITSSTVKIKIKTHNHINLLRLYKEC